MKKFSIVQLKFVIIVYRISEYVLCETNGWIYKNFCEANLSTIFTLIYIK